MSKKVTVWLIVAASLVVAGGMIFVGVMTVLNWDFRKLTTARYETNDYVIEEEFKGVSIVTDTADIDLIVSDSETSKVVCYERGNEKHEVSVKDGTLTIHVANTKKWYEHIGINMGAPKITVSIPAGAYGALTVKTDTGDLTVPEQFSFERMDVSGSTGDVKCYASVTGVAKIGLSTGHVTVENVSVGRLDCSVSTGDVALSSVNCAGDVTVRVSTGKARLADVSCENLISSGDTGDLSLVRVMASGRFEIERSTGDVSLERCDAAELSIVTDTGDVTGTLCSEKIFFAESDTGRVEVPKSMSGGRCEVKTDTGKIILSIG